MSVRPAKTQISLGFRPVWSESSLSSWRKLGSLATHWEHSEDSDRTDPTPPLRPPPPKAWPCRFSWNMYTLGVVGESWSESSLSSWRKLGSLAIHSERTPKTLIRLGGCPGWSESSLGAHSFCWFCNVATEIDNEKPSKCHTHKTQPTHGILETL